MTREDLLKAFARLSPEDQESIRAELAGKTASSETIRPMEKCQEMMDRMKCC